MPRSSAQKTFGDNKNIRLTMPTIGFGSKTDN